MNAIFDHVVVLNLIDNMAIFFVAALWADRLRFRPDHRSKPSAHGTAIFIQSGMNFVYQAAERYWSPNYIQYSARIEPGRDGLFNLIRNASDTLSYEH